MSRDAPVSFLSLTTLFLQLRVYDKDELSDDSLGCVEIPLSEDDFSGGSACSQRLPLSQITVTAVLRHEVMSARQV